MLGAPSHVEDGDEGGDGDEGHSFWPPAYLFIFLILFVESYHTYGLFTHPSHLLPATRLAKDYL